MFYFLLQNDAQNDTKNSCKFLNNLQLRFEFLYYLFLFDFSKAISSKLTFRSIKM